MTWAQSIEMLLDLRESTASLTEPEEFLSLWAEFSARLSGKLLPGHAAVREELPEYGVVKAVQISEISQRVDGQTGFAIHSVLEQPAAQYRCRFCAQAGRRRHGTLSCADCEEQLKGRVCVDHAVLLHGCVRADGALFSSCTEHAPRCDCDCQTPATFYCVECGRAKCTKQRRSRPGDSDNGLCASCFATLYPACNSPVPCSHIGVLQCEFVDEQTETQCAQRLCREHAWDWLIYGTNREGLIRCEKHQDTTIQSNEEIIYQLVAGTALRNRRAGGDRRGLSIPRLQSVLFTFLHARKDVRYSLRTLDRWFEELHQRLVDGASQDSLRSDMNQLLKRHQQTRIRNLREDELNLQQGNEIAEKLRQLIRNRGLGERLASKIRVVNFRPAQPGRGALLVLHPMPVEDRGALIGRERRRINEIQQELRTEIKLDTRRLIDDNA